MADLTLQHLAVGEGEASQMHCAMFTTSALPVNRPEDLSTHPGHFPKRDFLFLCRFPLFRDECFSHVQMGEAGRGQSDPAVVRRFRCARPNSWRLGYSERFGSELTESRAFARTQTRP